jgi:hypothetical protein
MSFFQKSKILLKKHYIIHFFSVRMRYSRTLPLCYGLVVVAWSRADHYAVVLKVAESSQTDGPKVGEVVLGNLVLIFLGMFLIFGFY